MKLKVNQKYLNIKIAADFTERLIGLIGKTNIDYGLLFLECNAIHTYLMKETIDILVLNKEYEIIFKLTLKPNKIFYAKRSLENTNILELPQGYAKYFKLGEKIKIIQ